NRAFANRRHFFAAAAEAMRRILVDSARRKQALKRGVSPKHIPVDPDRLMAPVIDADSWIDLDEVLSTPKWMPKRPSGRSVSEGAAFHRSLWRIVHSGRNGQAG